jgi:hypothetical protein
VSTITRGRLVRTNQVILDQADFFQGDGFTRQAGLTIADVTSVLFYDNVLQPWTFTNGAPVSDSQVKSGSVYLHEIAGSPGYYSMRFRPNAAGYWRLLVVYTAGQQILAQDYDVAAEPLQIQGGLTASFTNC